MVNKDIHTYINEALFQMIRSIGIQPARLYGLAKIHKTAVPVRPILSMLGSAYHQIATHVADWLSVNVMQNQLVNIELNIFFTHN